MKICFETPDQPEVLALVAELDAYQDRLYPPESRYALDLTTLAPTQMLFAVAREAGGAAVGCAALVLEADAGELKRMYVSPRCRGQGVATKLLESLEARALQGGCTVLRLETGPFQPEALGLYESRGYRRRGPFGTYRDDPLSVFMEKALASPAGHM